MHIGVQIQKLLETQPKTWLIGFLKALKAISSYFENPLSYEYMRWLIMRQVIVLSRYGREAALPTSGRGLFPALLRGASD